MRTRLLLVLCAAALAATVVPAAAARQAWYSYGAFAWKAPIEGGTGTQTARLTQILLPSSFKVKTRGSQTSDSGTYLAFGPVGSCRSTGSVRLGLLYSEAQSAADVLADVLPATTTSYGYGTRGDAAWRIVKSASATLRGAYVRPATARLAHVWVVVRVGTTPHGTCHAGGYRESVAFPLADALATVKASAY
ncbi:MAG TPA: hypothetical protein VHB30_09110 [Solirubrobacteraceae bacterium]|jgi:hypothetical protein|nr:hypothetical protein [Solirubrobacteraceae bacterium]